MPDAFGSSEKIYNSDSVETLQKDFFSAAPSVMEFLRSRPKDNEFTTAHAKDLVGLAKLVTGQNVTKENLPEILDQSERVLKDFRGHLFDKKEEIVAKGKQAMMQELIDASLAMNRYISFLTERSSEEDFSNNTLSVLLKPYGQYRKRGEEAIKPVIKEAEPLSKEEKMDVATGLFHSILENMDSRSANEPFVSDYAESVEFLRNLVDGTFSPDDYSVQTLLVTKDFLDAYARETNDTDTDKYKTAKEVLSDLEQVMERHEQKLRAAQAEEVLAAAPVEPAAVTPPTETSTEQVVLQPKKGKTRNSRLTPDSDEDGTSPLTKFRNSSKQGTGRNRAPSRPTTRDILEAEVWAEEDL